MNSFNSFLETANAFLWHNAVLFRVLGTGITSTLWTRFSQFRSLTHGLHVIRGRYTLASCSHREMRSVLFNQARSSSILASICVS